MPAFEGAPTTERIVTVKGRTVNLNCKVIRLGERTVSWVKRNGENLDLLTVGLTTYHSDMRYALLYVFPNNWSLRIQSVQERDQGTYECQVSTHPPLIKTVSLVVRVPLVQIKEATGEVIHEKFYEMGSSIDLQCVATNVIPSAELTWLKENAIITTRSSTSNSSENYMSPYETVSKSKEKEPNSWLRIASASSNDTGNYSCNALEASPAYVKIHVLDGEDSVAMQHSTNSSSRYTTDSILLILILFYTTNVIFQ